MNNILYFASKFLKWTFEKMSHKIGSIICGRGIKYLLNTVQLFQYFTSNYLKRTFGEKSHEAVSIKHVAGLKYLYMIQKEAFTKSNLKSSPSNMLLRCTIYLIRSNRWQSKTLKQIFKKLTWNQVHQIWSWYLVFVNPGSIGGHRKNADEFRSFKYALREKWPNTELFLVRIFPHSDWIRRIRRHPKCGKILTRNNSMFEHFSRSDGLDIKYLWNTTH